MRQIILDANFIMSCVRNKIDFFEGINLMGIQIIIPKQIISEVEKIAKSRQKIHNRETANLALKILKKSKFREIDLGRGHADKKIIKFAGENPVIIIATLDKEIQSKIKNQKMIIRGKKNLEIV